MGMKEDRSGESPQEETAARAESTPTRGRKLYQKPAFRFERVFETMALSCGKTNSTQSQCRFNRKNS
ncbi:MAG: hypothetical protein LAO30_10720 [Acidobacteriia bacterium]|nr:hypothetical protein [Terriglobia bacterium]